VLDLARENEADVPFSTLDELERLLAYDNFLEFLAAFAAVNRSLARPADFERIAREAGEDLAGYGAIYGEIRYAPMHPARRGMSFDDVTAAVLEGMRQAMATHPTLHLQLICGLTRQFGVEECLETTRDAVRWAGRGMTAIDIGGDEAGWPAELFEPVYALAREAGLGATAHAGEAAGPESVRAAVRILGVRRVGHGIRSIEDPVLIRELVGEGVTLEVCPTSNLRTGIVSSYESHPLRRLIDAGVRVSLGSDDPAMFGTTLQGEYEVAAGRFGFTEAELMTATRNGIEAGFCDAATKGRLLSGLS
jgi:adenosine deaminase